MSKEKIEEETYSLIFKSLKHPIRRKILRILVDKQLAFSRILDILSIDSGHLSYHIENLGDLVKHSADGKYELSSIGMAAVNLMSGVEERPQILTPTGKLGGKKIRSVLMGAVLAILVISAALNIYYYRSSQETTERIQGATFETAWGFEHSLNYATWALESLESEAKRANASLSNDMRAVARENAHTLIRHFQWHIYSARRFLFAFRLYLLPSYGESLLIVESLLDYMSVGGLGGFSDTLDYLMSLWWTNVSMVANAFEEINLVASDKIREMGNELLEAFEGCIRRFTGDMKRFIGMESFRIDHSRLENVVLVASELRTILNEWVAKYSQM